MVNELQWHTQKLAWKGVGPTKTYLWPYQLNRLASSYIIVFANYLYSYIHLLAYEMTNFQVKAFPITARNWQNSNFDRLLMHVGTLPSWYQS